MVIGGVEKFWTNETEKENTERKKVKRDQIFTESNSKNVIRKKGDLHSF